MIVKIISLEDSVRRQTIPQRFLSTYKYSIFNAVSDKSISSIVFDNSVALQRYQRNLRKTEVYCSLSHFSAITQCDERKIILEDDFILTHNFDKTIEILGSHEFNEPVIIILGHAKMTSKNLWWQNLKQITRRSEKIRDLKIKSYWNVNFCGAVGYFINERAIQVLKCLKSPTYIADDWDAFSELGVKIWHLENFIVYENLGFESQNGNLVTAYHNIFSQNFFSELKIFCVSLILRASLIFKNVKS